MYRIGIDVGGMSVKTGLVDQEYNIVDHVSVPVEKGFENVLSAVTESVRQLFIKTKKDLKDIEFCGIGTPGFSNPETGRLVYSANLDLSDVPLLEEMRKQIEIPCGLGNDANCAVIGETLAGSAKGYDNVLMITLGTGLGGGVIVNGKLFTGGHGMGAELGHMPIAMHGEQCSCGLDGCFEAYASVSALIRQTEKAIMAHPESKMADWVKENGKVNGRTSFDCAKQGDKTALEVVDQYEEYIAKGLGGLISVFRPEICLIGGGVSAQREYLTNPIQEKLKKYVFAADLLPIPEVKAATLLNDAGIIGAAFVDRM